MESDEIRFRGRGAQLNPHNPFRTLESVIADATAVDEPFLEDSKTEFYPEYPKKAINKIDSPDLGLDYSVNPYQGCEHGCVYCYARNTHAYWGHSAGLDFERKIIVKENVAELVEKQLNQRNWVVKPIMLSGNTDCYQPIERQKKLTRSILEVMVRYRHPVSIITKNSLILRDLDLLKDLRKDNLIHVNISITSLEKELRLKLEPRTASARKRLQTVETLAANDIPVNVMTAPIIPGLNSMEIPQLVKAAAQAGASSVAYTMVRLNGQVGEIFSDWIQEAFPDRAQKVLNQIAAVHGGQLSDNRFGVRMRGEGQVAESIRQLFHIARRKHFKDRKLDPLNREAFRPVKGKQMSLFG